MAGLLLKPSSDEARQLVAALSGEAADYLLRTGKRTRRMKQDARERFEVTLGALLGDLVFAANNTEAAGYCWRQSKRELFRDTLAESRHYEAIKVAWKELGYIEVTSGFRDKDDWDGVFYYPNTVPYNWASRLRASERLLSILRSVGVTPETANLHFRRDQERSEPLILKAAKRGTREGKKILLPDTDRCKELSREVAEINIYLERQTFSFGPAPYLYRSYNNGDHHDFDWNYGGRFYTHGITYLNGSKEDRHRIQINGSEVIEMDIAACQLTILHGLVGIDLDTSKDPYKIDGIGRERVKSVVNICIGKGDIPNLDVLRRSSSSSKQQDAAIIEHFPALQKLRAFDLDSLRLQAIDSNIMAATLLKLAREHDIPALPVHDCIIVRIEDAQVAKEVFADEFHQQVGLRPRITEG